MNYTRHYLHCSMHSHSSDGFGWSHDAHENGGDRDLASAHWIARAMLSGVRRNE